ncbi:hypothetical protein AB0O47_39355, partial [Streptomyces noursei]|uniref:hypothetical protein n=1 Tax=Streptomyces noursei TaxID=1971 RepID=UPI00344D4D23
IQCNPPSEYTIAMTLCALDPELVLIMQPAWCAIRDSAGTIVGFTAKGKANCDSGFALELWMNVYSGAGAACRSGGASQHGYLLFPCITNVQVGEFTVQNGPISFSFSGTTKRGSNWGRGPYNVMMDDGQPSPLPCPVADDDDFIQFLTTFPPPEAECGRQPVDGGIPEPAELYIQGAAGQDRCTVELRPDNHGFGPVEVDWGDGQVSDISNYGTGTHTYTDCTTGSAPVEKTIIVRDKRWPQIQVEKTILVPLPPDAPVLTVYQDPTDTTGRTAIVDVELPPQAWCGAPDDGVTKCACPGESQIGKYGISVDWGDSAGPDRIQWIATDDACKVRLRHQYENNGTFSIKICRNDIDTWCSKEPFIAGGGLRPLVRFREWQDNCTAVICIDNWGKGTVSIDWGTGTPEGRQTGVTPGANIPFTYGPNFRGRRPVIVVCAEAQPGQPGSGARCAGTLRPPVCPGVPGGCLIINARCDSYTDPSGQTVALDIDTVCDGGGVISECLEV